MSGSSEAERCKAHCADLSGPTQRKRAALPCPQTSLLTLALLSGCSLVSLLRHASQDWSTPASVWPSLIVVSLFPAVQGLFILGTTSYHEKLFVPAAVLHRGQYMLPPSPAVSAPVAPCSVYFITALVTASRWVEFGPLVKSVVFLWRVEAALGRMSADVEETLSSLTTPNQSPQRPWGTLQSHLPCHQAALQVLGLMKY